MTIDTTNFLKIIQIKVDLNGIEYIYIDVRTREDDHTLLFTRSKGEIKLESSCNSILSEITDELFEKMSENDSFDQEKVDVKNAVLRRLENAIKAFTSF